MSLMRLPKKSIKSYIKCEKNKVQIENISRYTSVRLVMTT